jgi:hypothetical protein
MFIILYKINDHELATYTNFLYFKNEKEIIQKKKIYCRVTLEIGLTASVTSLQGMLTPSRHLIPPLVYPEVCVCPILLFVLSTGLMRLISVRYFISFILYSTGINAKFY